MKRVFYLFVLSGLLLLNSLVYSQPVGLVYANGATSGGTFDRVLGTPTGEYKITDPLNAVNNGSLTDFTRLFARNDALATATAFIQMTFPTSVPANSTIFVKTTLSAMSLLLAGGGVTISYVNGANATVTVGASEYKTYYTGDGNIYFSIKPTAVLQSLRITATAKAALGGNITMDIFYAFYGSDASNESYPFSPNVTDCGSANYSTFSTSGLTVGSFGVSSPGAAIDDNLTTMSSYYATGLSLLTGKIAQTFYFNGISNSADAVRIVFSRSPSLVAVDLAKSITVTAYKGVNKVGESQSLFALLDLDLLGLLGQGSAPPVTTYMAPKNSSNNAVTFDRVVVELDIGLLGVGLGSNGFNILDVRRVPDMPQVTNPTACTNLGKISLQASSVQQSLTSFTFKWYNAIREGSLLSGLTGSNPLVTGLTTVGQSNYYVDITKSGCSVPSGRAKVTVNTVTPPTAPPVALVP